MSFFEQFPKITQYTNGYSRFIDTQRLNKLYNCAVDLASTENTNNENEAKEICERILNENKNHMEARALLNYLCTSTST
jgi:hypothetical protein